MNFNFNNVTMKLALHGLVFGSLVATYYENIIAKYLTRNQQICFISNITIGMIVVNYLGSYVNFENIKHYFIKN